MPTWASRLVAIDGNVDASRVAISYQKRPIGVLTVSTHEPCGLDQKALRAITAIADVAAPLLRRDRCRLGGS